MRPARWRAMAGSCLRALACTPVLPHIGGLFWGTAHENIARRLRRRADIDHRDEVQGDHHHNKQQVAKSGWDAWRVTFDHQHEYQIQ